MCEPLQAMHPVIDILYIVRGKLMIYLYQNYFGQSYNLNISMRHFFFGVVFSFVI